MKPQRLITGICLIGILLVTISLGAFDEKCPIGEEFQNFGDSRICVPTEETVNKEMNQRIRLCEYDNQPTEEQMSACYSTCFESKTSGFFGLTNQNIAYASEVCGERCQDMFGCKPSYTTRRELMEERIASMERELNEN